MSNTSFSMPKEFAKRLLAHEAQAFRSAASGDSTAFRVCEKLRGPLAKLMGAEGFRSLLTRALALAARDVPWLGSMTLGSDGSFQGLDGSEGKLDAQALGEGELALVGQLLGLLVIFIGPAITLDLLHEIWPDWTIEIAGKDEHHEKD